MWYVVNMTAGIAWVSWKTTVFTGFQCGHNSISCLLKKTEIDEAILLTFAIHEKSVHVLHVLDLFDLLKKKRVALWLWICRLCLMIFCVTCTSFNTSFTWNISNYHLYTLLIKMFLMVYIPYRRLKVMGIFLHFNISNTASEIPTAYEIWKRKIQIFKTLKG